jgi:hypothetical protein
VPPGADETEIWVGLLAPDRWNIELSETVKRLKCHAVQHHDQEPAPEDGFAGAGCLSVAADDLTRPPWIPAHVEPLETLSNLARKPRCSSNAGSQRDARSPSSRGSVR